LQCLLFFEEKESLLKQIRITRHVAE